MQSMYNHKKAILATMHKKEGVIAPILYEKLGLHTFVLPEINTDQFGTFSREIARQKDQLETARDKALHAMDLANVSFGLASEGSFTEHPHNPFLPYNLELVVFIDREQNIEVVGRHASTKTNVNQIFIRNPEEALVFAKKVGFPEHGLIVRKNNVSTRNMTKGITSQDQLLAEITKLLRKPFTRKVFIETDMRANYNPTRMHNIALAAEDLAFRLSTPCPNCLKPGFGFSETMAGLPCERCALPTGLPLGRIFRCPACDHTEERLDQKQITAFSGDCARCNP